jgi:NUMOD3 motif
MTIQCQICFRTFEKVIAARHLKQHEITGREYKSRFGSDSLCTPEYREARSQRYQGENNPNFGKKMSDEAKKSISEKKKGRTAWNKGQKVTDPAKLERIRGMVAAREENYREQGHPNKGKTISAEIRKKIKEAVHRYSSENPELLKERAQKILLTKRIKGYDFGSSNRGPIINPEIRQKLIKSLANARKARTANIAQRHKAYSQQAEFQVLGYSDKTAHMVCAKCQTHFDMGVQYLTESKFRMDLCPVCREPKTKSSAELAILEFVRSIYSDTVLSGNRSLIPPLELDIYLPKKNLAIEFCGLYWHSENQGKTKSYHLDKHTLCLQKQTRLITIFEDEWMNHEEVVKSRIRHILGVSTDKLYARKCTARQIDNKIARDFCQENHIQEAGSCSIAYGLYHADRLVSVMSFSRPSISKGARNSDQSTWELNRFCSLQNTSIIGAANKLFTKFIRDYDPETVLTYSDRRWNTGAVYQNMGFVFVHTTPPNYWYILPGKMKRHHRFAFRKNKNDDSALTEWQNRKNQGLDRIWDCGNDRWVWTKK